MKIKDRLSFHNIANSASKRHQLAFQLSSYFFLSIALGHRMYIRYACTMYCMLNDRHFKADI